MLEMIVRLNKWIDRIDNLRVIQKAIQEDTVSIRFNEFDCKELLYILGQYKSILEDFDRRAKQ